MWTSHGSVRLQVAKMVAALIELPQYFYRLPVAISQQSSTLGPRGRFEKLHANFEGELTFELFMYQDHADFQLCNIEGDSLLSQLQSEQCQTKQGVPNKVKMCWIGYTILSFLRFHYKFFAMTICSILIQLMKFARGYLRLF